MIPVLLLAGCFATDEPTEEEPAPEVVAVLQCLEGMSEYEMVGTTVKFCYDPAWGEPVIAEVEVEVGKLFELTFPNSPDGPKLTYQTADYVGSFDFKSLENTLYGTEELMKSELAEQLGVSEDSFKARKSTVHQTRAARVHIGNETKYYVPNAFEGYHVTIFADDSLAVEVDEFAFDMIL